MRSGFFSLFVMSISELISFHYVDDGKFAVSKWNVLQMNAFKWYLHWILSCSFTHFSLVHSQTFRWIKQSPFILRMQLLYYKITLAFSQVGYIEKGRKTRNKCKIDVQTSQIERKKKKHRNKINLIVCSSTTQTKNCRQ